MHLASVLVYHGLPAYLRKSKMNKSEIRALIFETVPNIQDNELTNDATFQSLKIDSLDQMSIVLAIQESTGKQIPDEDIEKLNSINAIEMFIRGQSSSS